MTSQVKLDWEKLTFKTNGLTGWKSFIERTGLSEASPVFSDRCVYVIRVHRPFSFTYGNEHSPVAYIGKGQFRNRITSHLRSWMKHLSKRFPDLTISIWYCEPRVKRHGTICEGVEADLIAKFVDRYGQRPLRNRNTPTDPYDRSYSAGDLDVLYPGKGRGYEWGLSPLPSSHFYRA